MVASDGDPTHGVGSAEIEFLWRTGERAARIASLLEKHTRSGPVSVRTLALLWACGRALSVQGWEIRVWLSLQQHTTSFICSGTLHHLEDCYLYQVH